MATTEQSLIDIYAGKLIAKLHAAGIQASKTKNIIHAGIINWDQKATPENIGDVDFSFGVGSGGNVKIPHEIGIWKEIRIKQNSENSKVSKLEKKKQKLQKKLQSTTISDNSVNKINKQITELDEKIKKERKDSGNGKSNDKGDDLGTQITEFEKEAIENFNTYLSTFAGKELAGKFSKDKMIKCFLDPIVLKNMYDKKVVKDFEIIAWNSNAYKKYMKEIKQESEKTGNAVDLSIIVCYKIRYKMGTR